MIKNDLPILEYDPDKTAVLMPEHDNITVRLPEKVIFAFLGDEIDKFALSRGAEIAAHFESATKAYPVYVFEEKGQKICLAQAPVGAPAAVQFMEWLISYGARKIISAGSCGVLEKYEENVFLVPYKALREEGTSYHYLPPSRFVDVSDRARQAIEETLQAHKLPYREVITWSTDGFFRETKAKVARRKEEGCSVVEMECSALAACAQMRGIEWGQILYTADSLHDVENYDERNWGEDSRAYALELCLETLLRL